MRNSKQYDLLLKHYFRQFALYVKELANLRV